MRLIPVYLAALLIVLPMTASAESASFAKAGALYDAGCSVGVGALTVDGDEIRFEAVIPGCLPVGYAVTWSLRDDCGRSTFPTSGKVWCRSWEGGLEYRLYTDTDYDGNPDTTLVVHGVLDGGVGKHKIVGPSFLDLPA